MNIQEVSRKFHIHLGLLLLFFIWLFSFTGLLLNHGSWKFASFWDERLESKMDFTIPPSILKTPEPSMILSFLKITGEVQIQNRTSDYLQLRIYSPGVVRDLRISLISGVGSGKVIQFNKWGKLRTLHTFNGMPGENHSQNPNWWVTNIWRFAMDAIALGLIILCLTSWVMWYKVRNDFRWGYAILLGSLLLMGYFLF